MARLSTVVMYLYLLCGMIPLKTAAFLFPLFSLCGPEAYEYQEGNQSLRRGSVGAQEDPAGEPFLLLPETLCSLGLCENR